MLTLWLGTADAIWSIETSRLHHAARRRGGGVAVGGARAATGAGDRLSRGEHAFIPRPFVYRFCTAAARTRLDRGPHRRDRATLGRGTQQALCRNRGGVC